ncbi:MAG: hypothetical protein HKN16_07980, partial [Saprospiraceae bacterium]|nr:hypothetical protein [Saprospiraceae bacterium]
MRKASFLFIFVMATGFLLGQNQHPIFPGSSKLESSSRITLPTLDNDQLKGTELSARAPGRAPRFAENIEVDINPLTHGQWEEMGDRSIWRLVINSPG